MLETQRLVAATARKHGKFAGTVGGLGNMDKLIDMGYQFINLGADVRALASYFAEIAEKGANRDAKDPNKK